MKYFELMSHSPLFHDGDNQKEDKEDWGKILLGRIKKGEEVQCGGGGVKNDEN